MHNVGSPQNLMHYHGYARWKCVTNVTSHCHNAFNYAAHYMLLHLGLGKATSVAFGRQGGLGQGSKYWPRFFLDGDKTSVVMSGGIQAMMVTGARGRFHKDKLPA